MYAANLSGTTFPSRNLVRAFFALTLALNGCAASKGFLAGAVGGVPYIDEVRHGEVSATEFPTSLKVFGHETILISMAYAPLWPLAVVYGVASGSYGAYHFWKIDNAVKTREGMSSHRMPGERGYIPE